MSHGRGRTSIHQVVVQVVVAVMVFVACLIVPAPMRGLAVADTPKLIPLLLLACGALTVRSRWPLAAWAVTLATAAVATATTQGPSLVVVPLFVAIVAVALHHTLSSLAAVVAVTAGCQVLVFRVTGVDDGFIYAAIGWTGMVAALGAALRYQRAVVAAAEERALRAEQSKERDMHQAVLDERLRIARDLHDVVAHHVAVVNVQAGVVQHLLERDPIGAKAAADVVRSASKAVLTEMAGVVGLLRNATDEADRRPTPTLERIEDLVQSARTAGLDVTWTLSGRPVPLPALVDVTAYRVAQEALTNATRHGRGSARLHLSYEGEEIHLQVANALRPSADGGRAGVVGGGHGLIGMRERVVSVGGRLTAGPAGDGSYLVDARLPAAVDATP